MNVSEVVGEHTADYARDTESYMLHKLSKTGDGELKESCLHLPRAGGKMLRPIVFLNTCELFQDDYRKFIPIAAGIESLHVSTLIQDDLPLMDDDDKRRGVDSVHVSFDEATASLASSILQSKSYGWCGEAEIKPKLKESVIRELDDSMTRIAVGQDMDIRMENKTDTTIPEYIEMARNKTANLYRTSSKLGALVTEKSDDSVAKMADYGEYLGLAFQIVDDLLDFRRNGTGKDTFSDVENNKSTFVTIHANQNDVPVFSNNYTTEEKVQMIEDCGSVEYAKSRAEEYAEEAKATLNDINEDLSLKHKDCLRKIADVTISRTY